MCHIDGEDHKIIVQKSQSSTIQNNMEVPLRQHASNCFVSSSALESQNLEHLHFLGSLTGLRERSWIRATSPICPYQLLDKVAVHRAGLMLREELIL